MMRVFCCIQVEGLGDVIHAETELQRKQAFRQMSGELAELYQSWRQQIIKVTDYSYVNV